MFIILAGTALPGFFAHATPSSFCNNTNSSQAPTVFTDIATDNGQRSAWLNSCVNPNGNLTQAWFQWGTTQSFENSTQEQPIGGYSTFGNPYYISIQGLQANTTYYFRVMARNNYGVSQGNSQSFRIAPDGSLVASTSGGITQNQNTNTGQGNYSPTVSTSGATTLSQTSVMLKGLVTSNNSQTTAWFEYGQTQSLGLTAGYQSISSYAGSQEFSYTLTNLNPYTTYYYRAVAQNSYGTNYGSLQSFSTTGSGSVTPPPPYSQSGAPTAETRYPTVIHQNTAVLNGQINPGGNQTVAWYEWGKTASLGSRTQNQNIEAFLLTDYLFALSGLSPSTTYYYRLVAQNSYGTSNGEILNFTTRQGQTLPPPVPPAVPPPSPTPPQPPAPSPSPTAVIPLQGDVLFTSTIDGALLRDGKTAPYGITYKNTTNAKLSAVSIKVILPDETEYVPQGITPTSNDSNVLTFALGDLESGNENTLTIHTRLKNSIEKDDVLIITSILEYRDPSSVLHTKNTSLTITSDKTVSGFAAIGKALTSGIVLFIFAILLIIIGYVAVYRIMNKTETTEPPANLPTDQGSMQ